MRDTKPETEPEWAAFESLAKRLKDWTVGVDAFPSGGDRGSWRADAVKVGEVLLPPRFVATYRHARDGREVTLTVEAGDDGLSVTEVCFRGFALDALGRTPLSAMRTRAAIGAAQLLTFQLGDPGWEDRPGVLGAVRRHGRVSETRIQAAADVYREKGADAAATEFDVSRATIYRWMVEARALGFLDVETKGE